MYLLNANFVTELREEFANRYKKEQYKKLGTTQKQLYKNLISDVNIWNKYAGKYSQNASNEYRKWATPTLIKGKNLYINHTINTDLKLGRSKTPGFFNKDTITRINIDRRNRIEYLKDKIANKTKSVPNIGYKVITDSPKINVANVNTSKALTNTTKIPKTKLLTKTKLAIGIAAATGIGLLTANKLRKSRSDKNKKRNKYNKRK